MSIDLLAFGAHPDDCELFAGGMISYLVSEGHMVAICDLTRGEAASRGTTEERATSGRRSAEILGIQERISLDLGDAGLENTAQARREVVEVIRRLRPRAILTHHPIDRHPDHTRAHHLVRECAFYATAGGFEATGERLEDVSGLFYFFGNAPTEKIQPDFIVPISDDDYQRRAKALECYANQFRRDSDPDVATLISSTMYAKAMEARYRYFGVAVGVEYGEPYAVEKAPAIQNPLSLF